MAKYILIQTLGITRIDPKGGDGAYAEWMAEYFRSNVDKECVAFARLTFSGKVGNNPRYGQMTKQFKEQLKNKLAGMQLTVSEVDETGADEDAMAVDVPVRYAILNWHLRYTGHPNGYTGRKPGKGVLNALKEICKEQGIELKVVYTIHEEGKLDETHLLMADGVFALNPTVGTAAKGWVDKLNAEHGLKAEYGLSKVPTLQQSEATRLIEKVYQYFDLDEESKYSLAAANVAMFRALRPRAGDRLNSVTPARRRGIVIFGSITARHGLTSQTVENLCNALDDKDVSDDFLVLIAGKTPDTEVDLQKELEQLAAKKSRLHFIGEVDARLSELDQIRYAISFDSEGFRTNASAMVNMITNGILLFQRLAVPGPERSDSDLIAYAAARIAECESPGRGAQLYRGYLEAQQKLYPALSAAAVGAELDRMFAAVASQPPRTPPPSLPSSRASSPRRSPSPPAKRMRKD